jgi:signal transduction histidine kinase
MRRAAVGIMSVLSVVLGWLVAGRVLRPLCTITATTRDTSATSLHKRLGLDGPDDELKDLGDTIDHLLGRLERAFDAQHQFVANASHELRTPLARQRTVVQVAPDDPAATVESLRTAHERVLAAGAQQERLIEALLSLARGQAGRDRRQPLDLAVVTETVFQGPSMVFGHEGLDLRAELAPAPTFGDAQLVEQLIANLVDNAIRHNRPDGSIRVITNTLGGHAVLVVTNTGPLVPADAVGQLFQPFQRLSTDRDSRGEGLGLGLSIVRAIADPHAATISVHPRREGGLEIEVTFPPASTPALPEPVSGPVAASPPSPAAPSQPASELAAHVQQ